MKTTRWLQIVVPAIAAIALPLLASNADINGTKEVAQQEKSIHWFDSLRADAWEDAPKAMDVQQATAKKEKETAKWYDSLRSDAWEAAPHHAKIQTADNYANEATVNWYDALRAEAWQIVQNSPEKNS